jgi:hypothetical protein
MNLTSLLSRGRGLLRPSADPFGAAPTGGAAQPELRPVPVLPAAPRERQRSWFGWLFGNSRRREKSVRLVQGELILQKVKPMRNDFREDEAASAPRGKAQVLWETPRQDAPRDDQDHAWNRLRNRRAESLVVKAD